MAASRVSARSRPSISAYQKMPLPSQLMTRIAPRRARRRKSTLSRSQSCESQRWIRDSAASSRHINKDGLEVLHDALPGQALGALARCGAEAAREVGIARQGLGMGDEGGGVAERRKQRALPMAQHLARR